MESDLALAPPAPQPPKQKKPAGRKRLMFWLRLALSVGLLGYLLSNIDWQEAVEVFQKAHPAWLLLVLAVMSADRMMAALRWFSLLHGVKHHVPLAVVCRVHFMSSFLGQFMPGVVGMEALRVVAMGRATGHLAMAFASVFVDRVMGVMSLLSLVVLGLVLKPAVLPEQLRWLLLAVTLTLVLGCLAVLTPSLRGLVEKLTPGPLRAKVVPKLRKVYACLDAYRARPGLLLLSYVLAVGVHLLNCTQAFAVGLALGVTVPWWSFYVFTPMVMFAVMMPLSISGLGVREGLYAFFFSHVGMPLEQAVTMGLATMLLVRVASLPGMYFVITTRKDEREALERAAATTDLDRLGPASVEQLDEEQAEGGERKGVASPSGA